VQDALAAISQFPIDGCSSFVFRISALRLGSLRGIWISVESVDGNCILPKE
jgi:hypothetical protein